MPKYKITVYREWTEYGEIEIEASDADSARDEATDILTSDDGDIDWQSSNMEPGNQGIEDVEEV